MMSLVMSPIFWIGIALVIVAIIVLSALIGNKRNKEVEELETYFPEEEQDNANRISVEKVRRSTLARQQRKQASQHLPRRQPREDVLELEKQEYVTSEQNEEPADWEVIEPEEEDNLNLPVVQENLPTTTERQFNRRQYKSNILSKNVETSEETQSPITRRTPYTRRTPLASNTNTTNNTSGTRSPIRRSVGSKTAYPSIRRDSTTEEEITTPRFPNRRTKRLF